jgi:hypothetical protein
VQNKLRGNEFGIEAIEQYVQEKGDISKHTEYGKTSERKDK